MPAGDYGAVMHRGMERMSAGWFEHLLVPAWLPALPDVQRRLHNGADVADIGCGAGRAMIALASAFPAARCTGLDLFEPALERARANAERADVADRVRFVRHDAAEPMPGSYDLVTLFDVLHDSRDVGANYQDHLEVSIYGHSHAPLSLLGEDRGLKALRHGLQWMLCRTGLLTSNVVESGAFVDTTGSGRPDIHAAA